MNDLSGEAGVAVTREAARCMARLFDAMVTRGEDRARAQRFVLQRVAAMFEEGLGLGRLDLLADHPIPPVALSDSEAAILGAARALDWAAIEPRIFGTLFQASIGQAERHALGAHFTAEAEIARVILPTVVRPFEDRIAAAGTAEDLARIRADLHGLRVLDPACGTGNFLYVAYRELRRLDHTLLTRIREVSAGGAPTTRVSIRQLHGIDRDPFAVELARAVLLIAARTAADGAAQIAGVLDENIRCDDALFCAWPRAEIIIGNPPYQSKNKAQRELGRAYLNRLRRAYPDIPGHADHCVYWFRRAHDELPAGGRAGLVGTNTIRENRSREGGLDHILRSGGTIIEAVSSQVWPADAVVHVSIVNWVKGEAEGPKVLWEQTGGHAGSTWRRHDLPFINAALSPQLDVTAARRLSANVDPKTTFQGQTPGSRGFLVSHEIAAAWRKANKACADVLFPYLVGDDLLDDPSSSPARAIIDFGDMELAMASRYEGPFDHVKRAVLEGRRRAADGEEARNAEARAEAANARTNRHHGAFLVKWWQLSYRRRQMLEAIGRLPRYIAVSRVTRRPIFEVVSSAVRPSDALQVFAFSDDYSFGILQSDVHWRWFTARCSGLKVDPRYTSETVYGSFPWPEAPTREGARAIAVAAASLRAIRRAAARDQGIGLRKLYRLLDRPGSHPLKDAHAALDAAVRAAYGMSEGDDPLGFLLDLNLRIARRASAGEGVPGPGLPPGVGDHRSFVSEDCVGR